MSERRRRGNEDGGPGPGGEPVSGQRDPLAPLRHLNLDFFIADFSDAAPKDDIASMEHPVFALKPGDATIRRYEHKGNTVEVIPSALGHATIHDKDILIYCTSQLVEALNRGLTMNRAVRFNIHEMLVATNRPTDGDSYKRSRDALDRLAGTRIKTNIATGGTRIRQNFGLIDSYRIVERSPADGRMIAVEIKLSEWLMNAITGREVLTIDRDYFRLRKPIERRLYELARKHCGGQPSWKCGIAIVHKKTGATSTLREFRRLLHTIAENQHLPEYELQIDADADTVTFVNRSTPQARHQLQREDAEQSAASKRQQAEQEFRRDWERDNPGKKWPGYERARAAMKQLHLPRAR